MGTAKKPLYNKEREQRHQKKFCLVLLLSGDSKAEANPLLRSVAKRRPPDPHTDLERQTAANQATRYAGVWGSAPSFTSALVGDERSASRPGSFAPGK
jgi:hypothetical protein